jgi:ketosteroid isomerase-like protein
MKSYFVVLLALGAAVGSVACAAAGNVEQEKAALLAADTAWGETTGDLDKFVSYYTPDATSYPPGRPAANGTNAIREGVKNMMAAPGFSLKWTANKADASGDLGYTAGTYVMTMNNPAGNPVSENGKFVTMWKKQGDGAWKVVQDIFNSDAPPPSVFSPHNMVAPSAVQWTDPPPVFPKGAKLAVIDGDPSKAAPFTLRLQMPAGYRIAPHWHPTDERVTVLSGRVAVGMGDAFDEKVMNEAGAGGFVSIPATSHHFAMAKAASTIQIDGVGPFILTYVNPADDPSKASN